MSKKKKGGKRMSANKMVEKLEEFFRSHPNKSYSFKEIFKNLKLEKTTERMSLFPIIATFRSSLPNEIRCLHSTATG